MSIYFLGLNEEICLEIKKNKFLEIEFPSGIKNVDLKFISNLNELLSSAKKNDFLVTTHLDLNEQKKLKNMGINLIYSTTKAVTKFNTRDGSDQKIIQEAINENIPYIDIGAYVSTFSEGSDFSSFLTNWFDKYIKSNNLFNDFYFGASIYPEVWSEETLNQDLRKLKTLNMNTVRLGEFFWHKLEALPNKYSLNYLDSLLDKLDANGIKAIVGIPSPTPPRWFTVEYPDSIIVNADGTKESHGSRQHVCINHQMYRKKVYELTKLIAEHCSTKENVIGFQIDNEFKCHVDLCYCHSCEESWHSWLRQKYGSIDELNKKWGTEIWSEYYDSFEDVIQPKKTPFVQNSALMNAYRKFTADGVSNFTSCISQIITRYTSKPITHNTALGFNLQNNELFSQLDFTGFDTYALHDKYWGYTMNLDLWRNLKPNHEMMLLETSTSHVGYIGNYVAPHPKKYLQTEVFTGYASGLRTFLFWPFRAQWAGVEQTHSAVLTQSGEPDVGYPDVVESGKLFKKIEPILSNTKVVPSKIAIIYSDKAKRSFEIADGGIYNYRDLITEFYHWFIKNGISVELIQETSNLDDFNCIFVPFVRNISSTLMSKLKQKSQDGTSVIFGPMTNDRTEELTWRKDNMLGELNNTFNINHVVQVYSKDPETEVIVKDQKGNKEKLFGLVTAFYTNNNELVTDNPLIEERSVDTKLNNLYYLGGIPKNLADSKVFLNFLKTVVYPLDDTRDDLVISEGIVKYLRKDSEFKYYFLSNMSDKSASIKLNKKAMLLDGTEVRNKILFEPYKNLIIKMKLERNK